MKVCVIGAGPAGSYAALLLAKQGHDVHVFEDHPQVGVPVQCTGIVTHAIWDLIPKDASIIKTELDNVVVHGPTVNAVVPLHEFVLDRAKLDQYIAALAKKAGATYHLGHRFVRFEDKDVVVRHDGKEQVIPTDITIGADGPNSDVAKAAGIWTERKFWGGIQATIEGTYQPKEFAVFFGKDYPFFFGWAVPESKTVARVGIAAQHKARDQFTAITKRFKGKILGWQSGPIPIYTGKIPVQNKERTVFLVGDAAGLVKATTGGGIITGMTSSKILADALHNNRDYARALKPLHKDLRWHWLMRRMLNTFSEKDYDALIRLLGRKTVQNVLLQHPRDFPSRFALRLLVVEPRLLRFVKSFIKQLPLPFDRVAYER